MGDPTPSTESTPSFLIAPTPWHWRALIGGGIVLVGLGGYLARDAIGPRGQGVVGVVCIFGFVALLSANLRVVNWRTVGWGFALQWLLALFVLKFEVRGLEALGIPDGYAPGYELFRVVAESVSMFLDFTARGSLFVFGSLADVQTMERALGRGNGFVFAFQA